ncbi:MAG: hypothetical protein LWX56_11255 [Ignavibacteria bacterium]|nr:hypothetical protein [Ignavibacteria bacterium]
MAENFSARVNKYLQKYGRPGTYNLNSSPDFIDTIVVIPALAERNNLNALINSLAEQDTDSLNHTVFLFVVNNSEDADEEVIADNLDSLKYLSGLFSDVQYSKLSLAIIDCSSPGQSLPKKDAGVGLARKIGLDTALTLFTHQKPDNLLICLDADCTVPENYLLVLRDEMKSHGVHVASIQYEHKLPFEDEMNLRAIICYELFLRHYTLGLKYAGSDYAFHAVGSSMCFTAEAYIKAEGMNKQKAGEDFYFLQKAAKFTSIHTINSTRVYPSPRSSFRVPFGTGRSVARFYADNSNEYKVHALTSFVILKKWLAVFRKNNFLDGRNLLLLADEIDVHLGEFLREQKFITEWDKIRQCGGKLEQQQRIWFDGFKTMKLLHYLRDYGYPDMPTFEGVDALLGQIRGVLPLTRTERLPDIQKQIEYLLLMRKIASGEFSIGN